VKNILAGEVWFYGGQSNMRWHIIEFDGANRLPASPFRTDN
jgi:hypothetical protein